MGKIFTVYVYDNETAELINSFNFESKELCEAFIQGVHYSAHECTGRTEFHTQIREAT